MCLSPELDGTYTYRHNIRVKSTSNYSLIPQIRYFYHKLSLGDISSTLKRSVIPSTRKRSASLRLKLLLLLNQIPKSLTALTPKRMEDATVTESSEWEKLQTPADRTRGWEMVVAKDNKNNHLQGDLSVLPPSNHDDLQVPPQPQPSPPESPNDNRPSSDDFNCDEEGRKIIRPYSRQMAGNGISKLLVSITVWIGGRARYYASCRSGFCSFASLSIVVGVVLLYRRVQRWRQWLKAENHRLILTLKEKDQKIDDLFHQVVQLKKMLSARREVPVIHVR